MKNTECVYMGMMMVFCHVQGKRNKKLLLGADGTPVLNKWPCSKKLVLAPVQSIFMYQRSHKTIVHYIQLIFQKPFS